MVCAAEQFRAALDGRIQAHALDQLHCIIVGIPLGTLRIDRHDVGMIQSCGGAGLAVEAFSGGGAEPPRAGHHFKRDRTIEGNLSGVVHNAHAATAQFGNDFEIGKSTSGEELLGSAGGRGSAFASGPGNALSLSTQSP